MIVWWGTPVEIHAAFARRLREKEIATQQYEAAARRLNVARDGWSEVTPTERVPELVERLPGQYRLRAADAFQLAAALTWSNEKPRNRPFISFDARLAESARDAGFEIIFHDYKETRHHRAAASSKGGWGQR